MSGGCHVGISVHVWHKCLSQRLPATSYEHPVLLKAYFPPWGTSTQFPLFFPPPVLYLSHSTYFNYWSFPNICLFISWVLQINSVTFFTSSLLVPSIFLKIIPWSQEWNIIQVGLIRKVSWAERGWLGHCISLQCSWTRTVWCCWDAPWAVLVGIIPQEWCSVLPFILRITQPPSNICPLPVHVTGCFIIEAQWCSFTIFPHFLLCYIKVKKTA